MGMHGVLGNHPLPGLLAGMERIGALAPKFGATDKWNFF